MKQLGKWASILGVAVIMVVVLNLFRRYVPAFDWNSLCARQLWALLAACLPAYLIAQQGWYLLSSRDTLKRGLNARRDDIPVAAPRVEITLPASRNRIDVEYGLTAITSDYYLPALLNCLTGVALAYITCCTESLGCCVALPDSAYEGVRLGALGAYVYVVMMLCQRTYQRDVTTGVAMWSTAQMVLGPMLGGLTAVLITDKVQVSEFTQGAFYFVAGLAPREIVNVIQATIDRFWSGGKEEEGRKLIPLNRIRGITSEVEARLSEDGVTDVYMLSMADPLRLLRNTPYELRQITAWMDEAFLYAVLPDLAAAIQKEGITGAIDLAYYYVTESLSAKAAPTPRIQALATQIRLDPSSLTDTIRRLYEDSQVSLIWGLYQAEDGANPSGVERITTETGAPSADVSAPPVRAEENAPPA